MRIKLCLCVLLICFLGEIISAQVQDHAEHIPSTVAANMPVMEGQTRINGSGGGAAIGWHPKAPRAKFLDPPHKAYLPSLHMEPESHLEFKSVPSGFAIPFDRSSSGRGEADHPEYPRPAGFQWGPAIRQSLLFLGVQHAYAMTQPKTRRSLKGPFLKDYARSVRSLKGWADGGKFFTNYIAHPMQGSFTGFIHVQNDPRGSGETFGLSGSYWKSRLKAMAWSAAWSTQFEIGPISQASIGNVGLGGKQTYVDLVITPTVGTAMLITEDILDRFLVRRIEAKWNNSLLSIIGRLLLNPTRSVANLVRFKKPWYRDQPLRRK